MNAPGRGLLAILGGIGWGIGFILQGLVGREWPTEGPLPAILMLTVVGGAWMLAGATIGLAMVVGDRIHETVAWLVGLGAIVGAVSLVGGAYGFVVALPISSAALLWELRGIGAVGPWMARAHVIGAALVLVAVALLWANPALIDSPATAVAGLSLAVPYALSWIAIGWSLLRQPSAPESTATA